MTNTATGSSLRRGWTTGACATAAAKAAYIALVTGDFPDPVEITLPSGRPVSFALASHSLMENAAMAAVMKDAGDDPDVTHGATIVAMVRRNPVGGGITFHAGPGVGVVTKPGLPVSVGEAAINPVPRKMMQAAITQAAAALGSTPDLAIEIAIPGGEEIAKKTMNGRLGILGGLSILGTTGIVVPYSCSAWIASIRQAIDVAHALGIQHVIGSTGSTSEQAAARYYGAPDSALVEMGDFVGGMLKYLRTHPLPRVTIAGGFAKMAKLAAGALDLHSARSAVDLRFLSSLAEEMGAPNDLVSRMLVANTGMHVLELATEHGLQLAARIAELANETAKSVLGSASIATDVLVVSREGHILACSASKGTVTLSRCDAG
jgi:cobalt-precorrin-5B (C1)-methyltransferase